MRHVTVDDIRGQFRGEDQRLVEIVVGVAQWLQPFGFAPTSSPPSPGKRGGTVKFVSRLGGLVLCSLQFHSRTGSFLHFKWTKKTLGDLGVREEIRSCLFDKIRPIIHGRGEDEPGVEWRLDLKPVDVACLPRIKEILEPTVATISKKMLSELGAKPSGESVRETETAVTNAAWTPPEDWRPYAKGNPGKGRVKQIGEDGKSYSRPCTPEETVARAAKAPPAPAAPELRLTVGRLAEGIRDHMQMREKVLAVMDEANLSDQAVVNVIGWLAEWRGRAARRQIESKQAALQELQAEIEALRKVTKVG